MPILMRKRVPSSPVATSQEANLKRSKSLHEQWLDEGNFRLGWEKGRCNGADLVDWHRSQGGGWAWKQLEEWAHWNCRSSTSYFPLNLTVIVVKIISNMNIDPSRSPIISLGKGKLQRVPADKAQLQWQGVPSNNIKYTMSLGRRPMDGKSRYTMGWKK